MKSAPLMLRVVMIVLSFVGLRLAFAKAAAPRVLVTVHGTVLDYAGRAVEKASVSVSGRARAIETDRNGNFTAQAPPRSYVGAHKWDMIGHVILGDEPVQRVTIRMMQGPM